MPTTQSNPIYRADTAPLPPFGAAMQRSGAELSCFASGIRIDLASGRCAVEKIALGDLVQTLDNGLQPVRSVRREILCALGDEAPVVFAVGSVGNARAVTVSPGHRILITDWCAELLTGCDEVRVAARDLVNGRDVRVIEGGFVAYLHLVFDQTQIIFAEGCAFGCGTSDTTSRRPAARTVALRAEAACLMAA